LRHVSRFGRLGTASHANLRSRIVPRSPRVRRRFSTDLPGAEIAIDDAPVGKTPLGAAVNVSAGRRKVTATLRGYAPMTKTIEIAGAELQRVSFELALLAAAEGRASVVREPAIAVARTRSRPSTWWWAAPVGLGAGGLGLGVAALVKSSKLGDVRKDPKGFASDVSSLSRQTRNLALGSDVVVGTAIVSAAVLLVLTLTAPADMPRTPASTSAQLGIAPNGIAIAGRF
jgi:hypothetical protein